MNDMTYDLPCLVGIQGKRRYYVVNISFAVLSKITLIDTGNTLERSQRTVDNRRARGIGQYVINNPGKFVLPALTGVIDEKFYQFVEGADQLMGTLKLDMSSELKLFDGQHRAVGLTALMDENRGAFGHNTILVQIFCDMSLPERQQAFCDVNSTAKSVSSTLNATYNHRNNTATLMVEMIKQVPAWQGRVEWERSSCSGKSKKLFPFKAIIDATRLYLGKTPREDISQEEIQYAADFWTKVSDASQWTNTFDDHEHTCEIGRACFMSYHIVGLKAIALWGYAVFNESPNLEGALEALEGIRPALRRDAKHWMNKCTDQHGRMKSSREAVFSTARYLCELTNIKPSHTFE